ncbi:hypothetical protein H5410_014341 [Solanum commersonii]|uniref:Uncharacterized protein n=1 Tax=Solanum commersonii TaxID=4109 RepID=A0A9J5ZQM9_SOLCO|nr:hypothetical protein H5410_014341 [Solanum commersonii]
MGKKHHVLRVTRNLVDASTMSNAQAVQRRTRLYGSDSPKSLLHPYQNFQMHYFWGIRLEESKQHSKQKKTREFLSDKNSSNNKRRGLKRPVCLTKFSSERKIANKFV